MSAQIRPCCPDETEAVLAIINAAAQRYRGAIPDDCWHDPYMPAAELARDMADGVMLWAYEDDALLLGVMGVQPRGDVTLIRHAYVRPEAQGRGVGGALLAHLERTTSAPVLIGTWADATWAIGFYRRHGFELASREEARSLLQTYWNVPPRQMAVSVVLRKALPEAASQAPAQG